MTARVRSITNAFLQKTLIYLLCFLTPLQFAGFTHAVEPGMSLPEELNAQNRGHEYMSGATPGAVLMRVNLWGAVTNPGIHHIPARTDLVTLLSYAGGPLSEANLDDITVRRQSGDKVELIDVDVKHLLSSSQEKGITLQPNDVIVIPASRPLVSTNTVNLVSVVGGIFGIILAGVVISDRVSK